MLLSIVFAYMNDFYALLSWDQELVQLQKFCISLKCSNIFGTYYSTRFPAAGLKLLDLTTASDLPLFHFFLNCVPQFLTHGITGVY